MEVEGAKRSSSAQSRGTVLAEWKRGGERKMERPDLSKRKKTKNRRGGTVNKDVKRLDVLRGELGSKWGGGRNEEFAGLGIFS